MKSGCKALGVDMEKRFIHIAEDNLEKAGLRSYVAFSRGMAESIEITSDMDRFYFFNPFSYDIFKRILNNICCSYYENPREIYLLFYYPSDEYMGRLMTEDELMFDDEIDCGDLFEGKEKKKK